MTDAIERQRNLRHWAALERTDPAHTKPFDRGRFKGTATKPIWNERHMTEHFGPCGIGWGMREPSFTLTEAGSELLVFCTVALWYTEGETIATVYGVGGDKVVRVERSGPYVSDEAYKGAYTDALGNAMKHIGVNADVHMGMFEDSKYVRALREEFAETVAEPAPPPKPEPAKRRSEHPQRQEALDAYNRITEALEKAESLKIVNDIERLNKAEYALIKEVHPPAETQLRALAEGRRQEFRSAA